MKSYLVTTAAIFGLLALVHLLRTIAEWSQIGSNPGFIVEGPGIGLLAAALCVWGVRLLRSAPGAR
jgi:hypothetical protein